MNGKYFLKSFDDSIKITNSQDGKVFGLSKKCYEQIRENNKIIELSFDNNDQEIYLVMKHPLNMSFDIPIIYSNKSYLPKRIQNEIKKLKSQMIIKTKGAN